MDVVLQRHRLMSVALRANIDGEEVTNAGKTLSHRIDHLG